MRRTLLIYGLLLGVLIIALKAIEYRYLVRRLDVEVYLGMVAIICTALGIWFGSQLISRNPGTPPTLSTAPTTVDMSLSQREREILCLMADGHSNQEIADQLFISIHTVKTHSSNLYSKLDVKRRTQAISKARHLGLIADAS